MKGQIKMICEYTLENTLRIIVSDTGLGLPSEVIPHLFEPLERQEDLENIKSSCGLGLHISNLLVRLLGGNGIKVSSELFKGSSFIFEMSIHERDNITNKSSLSYGSSISDIPQERDLTKYINSLLISATSSNKLPSIMVVDDSDFIHEVIGTFLRKAGLMFEVAYTGKQAVDKVKNRMKTGVQFKVIVMDCDMPEMDGFTATTEIKQFWEVNKLEAMPNIIAHTTIISDEDTLKCFRSGMIDFIPKPTNEALFLKKIKQYL